MGRELPFLKLVSPLIDSGVWARMSAAARTLYPVLLRFSDGKFKPVYPGSQVLLKLTGFKQKSTLRRARRELVKLGLLWVTEGTGRANTVYHFRFDPLGGEGAPPSGAPEQAPGVASGASGGSAGQTPGVAEGPSPYNQIHISINNNVPAGAETPDGELRQMRERFGDRVVDLAVSECHLGGLAASAENLRKILYRDGRDTEPSWAELVRFLAERISPGSLMIIQESFRQEQHGVFIFSDNLPEYLKTLLGQTCPRVFFEPAVETVTGTGAFWRQRGETTQ